MFKIGKSPAQLARLTQPQPHRPTRTQSALPLMANPTLDMLVTHWHQPCWQMACIWLGAHSNITGRAVFYQQDQKNQMR